MVPLTALWLPIVLSAVFVFIVSSIFHMVLPFHKSDYRKLPDEEKVMDALRSAGVTPGPCYHFPMINPKEMKSPENQERCKRGPIGLMHVMPNGPINMGKFLGRWFVYLLLVSFFTAYLTGRVMHPGDVYLAVFRVAGTIAFMAYGVGQFPSSIWGGQAWSTTLKHVFDGLIYACVAAGTFGWLWPR